MGQAEAEDTEVSFARCGRELVMSQLKGDTVTLLFYYAQRCFFKTIIKHISWVSDALSSPDNSTQQYVVILHSFSINNIFFICNFFLENKLNKTTINGLIGG